MSPKTHSGPTTFGSGSAFRFSRALVAFAFWLAVIGFAPLARAITFTGNVTISEGVTTYNGQDIIVDGATATINGAHSFTSLSLMNGAVLEPFAMHGGGDAQPGDRGGGRNSWREKTCLHQQASVFPAMRHVDSEHVGRDSPDRRAPGQSRSVPAKVFVPIMPPRIENRCQLSRERINPGDIGPFMHVAVKAAQSQVVGSRRAVVFCGDDVIDLKGQHIEALRQTAVLAHPARSLPDEFAQTFIHPSGGVDERIARLRLHEVEKVSDPQVTVQFVAFHFAERALPVFFGEFVQAINRRLAKSQLENRAR